MNAIQEITQAYADIQTKTVLTKTDLAYTGLQT